MSDTESPTVLIVDDEALVLELLRTVLAGEGLVVLEARDGQEGLEVFKSNQSRIELVILDLNMPEMTGYDMQAELQIIDPDVKMIVVTGYMPDEERLVGVQEIVSKPIQIEKLTKIVREILDSN
jgi:two-component system cell cycle sensor histidine kinase/response regulator CckA